MTVAGHIVTDDQLNAVLSAARIVDQRRSEVLCARAAVDACNTTAPRGSYARRLADEAAADFRDRLAQRSELFDEASEALRDLLTNMIEEAERL